MGYRCVPSFWGYVDVHSLICKQQSGRFVFPIEQGMDMRPSRYWDRLQCLRPTW